jgi:SAM-dependent methyltransferase
VASFVDLGCGTGELLLSLRRLHPAWRLTGVDASAQMLAVARRKQAPSVTDIAWIQAELTAPLPRPPVDAVGAFYDTINHLSDPDALDKLLAAVAQALRPGGLFIFDVTNAVGFDKWWCARNHWKAEGWEISVETSYRPDAGVAHAVVTIVRDGRTPVSAHLVERCFPDREIRQALARAGLVVEVQESWSPFQIDAPGKTWWITRRKP